MKFKNLNKRISGRAGRRRSESRGGRKPDMSMEKGTRRAPTSRTPPRRELRIGYGNGAIGKSLPLNLDSKNKPSLNR